ncbi:MAG: hypothetical protein IKP00_12130 [Victivallales bacterium]|nr:hypothetical protein [Victivallales bacterium]
MNTNEKESLWYAIRQFIYLGGCFGVILLEHSLASVLKGQTFREYGVVENLQLCEVLLSCAIFLVLAFYKKNFRNLSIIFAGLCALAACRELDSFFDRLIPYVGWRLGFLFVFAALVNALLHFEQSRSELFLFLRHPSFEIMICAMILILPVAQCVGHRRFIVDVLEEEHVGRIKELLEESLETIGYFVLLCSALELFCKHDGSKKG